MRRDRILGSSHFDRECEVLGKAAKRLLIKYVTVMAGVKAHTKFRHLATTSKVIL
ncbi:MAG: hypothetical protein QXM73_02635 [Candidatus Nezhaarchaeales archaeon]